MSKNQIIETENVRLTNENRRLKRELHELRRLQTPENTHNRVDKVRDVLCDLLPIKRGK